MLTKVEAERIAGAVNILRPDWHPNGLMTVLADERVRVRPFRDVLLAMVALAADPASRKPTRIYEAGPWWEAVAPRAGESNTSAAIRRYDPENCDFCGRGRDDTHADHEYAPIGRAVEGARAPADLLDRIHRLERIRPPKPKPETRPVDDILADHTTQEDA